MCQRTGERRSSCTWLVVSVLAFGCSATERLNPVDTMSAGGEGGAPVAQAGGGTTSDGGAAGAGGVGGASPGWRLTPAAGPSPRWGHSLVYDEMRERAVLFGGLLLDPTYTGLWQFSVSTEVWSQLPATGGPSSRFTAATVADPARDRMIVFGGFSDIVNDDLWSFDFATSTWTDISSAGPPPLFDVAGTTDGTTAWFFGGFLQGTVATNELWALDLTTDVWTLLADQGDRPSPRTNIGFGYHGGFLYVVGGHDETTITPDIWRYSLGTQAWTLLDTTSALAAHTHFAFASDPACGALYLAGGDADDNVDVTSTDVIGLGATPLYGTLASDVLPPPHQHAALVMTTAPRSLVLFGGIHALQMVPADTYVYPSPACR